MKTHAYARNRISPRPLTGRELSPTGLSNPQDSQYQGDSSVPLTRIEFCWDTQANIGERVAAHGFGPWENEIAEFVEAARVVQCQLLSPVNEELLGATQALHVLLDVLANTSENAMVRSRAFSKLGLQLRKLEQTLASSDCVVAPRFS